MARGHKPTLSVRVLYFRSSTQRGNTRKSSSSTGMSMDSQKKRKRSDEVSVESRESADGSDASAADESAHNDDPAAAVAADTADDESIGNETGDSASSSKKGYDSE